MFDCPRVHFCHSRDAFRWYLNLVPVDLAIPYGKTVLNENPGYGELARVPAQLLHYLLLQICSYACVPKTMHMVGLDLGGYVKPWVQLLQLSHGFSHFFFRVLVGSQPCIVVVIEGLHVEVAVST
jgi:hypothetical protein